MRVLVEMVQYKFRPEAATYTDAHRTSHKHTHTEYFTSLAACGKITLPPLLVGRVVDMAANLSSPHHTTARPPPSAAVVRHPLGSHGRTTERNLIKYSAPKCLRVRCTNEILEVTRKRIATGIQLAARFICTKAHTCVHIQHEN